MVIRTHECASVLKKQITAVAGVSLVNEQLAADRITDSDITYITSNFRTLEDLCLAWGVSVESAKREILAGVMPGPAYTLPDGRELYPDDLFIFPFEVEPRARETTFIGRLEMAFSVSGIALSPDDSERAWSDYISGAYAICLRVVLPETIARKATLIAAIQKDLDHPEPTDLTWRRGLAARVNALDALLRPFADIDRIMAGGLVSRDRYVTDVRLTHAL